MRKPPIVGAVSIVALVALGGCGSGGSSVNSSGSAAPVPAAPAPASASPAPVPVAPVESTPVVPTPVAPAPVVPAPAVSAPAVSAPAVTAPVVSTPAVPPSPTPLPAATPVIATPSDPAPSPPTTSYPPPLVPPLGYLVTPAAKQPVRSVHDSAEYRQNFVASELVNGLYALDSNHDGRGVTVGITDDGAISVNGELDGRLSPLSKDFGSITSGGVRTRRDTIGDAQSDHGTAVANVIGAAANGSGTVGYAPAAQIAVLRISDWNADTQTETLTHVVEAMDYAARQGIKVLNTSLSTGGSVAWGDAAARFATTGGLIVKSAGNDGAAAPDDGPAISAANRNAVLFVGALAPYLTVYQMESYSNRAGAMMDRYVVAVGRNATTDSKGAPYLFTGTSAATPVVTGLVADILSKWPQLTGQQAGEIVLNTARDIGDPGVDPVFGHGLVDFQAALAPADPRLSNGATQTSLQASAMAVAAPIGVTAIQTVLSNVTLLDAYGRDYEGSIAGLVTKPQASDPRRIARRIRALGNSSEISFGGVSGEIGFVRAPAGPGGGESRAALTMATMRYAAGGLRIGVAWRVAESLQSDVMGLAPFADGVLAYLPQADSSLSLDHDFGRGALGLAFAAGAAAGGSGRAVTLRWWRDRAALRLSLIDERGSLLGTPTGSGALRLGRGARTMMIEGHRRIDLARQWQVEAYGSLGLTRLKIDPASLVTGATPLLGSRIGLQATYGSGRARWSVGIAQPLTIEAGAARLTYGQGYDPDAHAILYGSSTANLAGARHVQLTGGYAASGPRASFRIGVRQDVDNPATSALATWQARW